MAEVASQLNKIEKNSRGIRRMESGDSYGLGSGTLSNSEDSAVYVPGQGGKFDHMYIYYMYMYYS